MKVICRHAVELYYVFENWLDLKFLLQFPGEYVISLFPS